MRVARAAYPKGSLAMRLRDELGGIYQDEQFGSLFPTRGQPAEAPWRLAIVLVLQYVEGLTDRQAAEGVRGRIDWKYALGLELSDPGFDASVRIASFVSAWWLGKPRRCCWMCCWSDASSAAGGTAGGKQRTDSTHVLARVRSLSNLECVGETLRAALDDVAHLAADWLASQISPDWLERYSHRVENYRLRHPPKANAQPWLSKSGRMVCICSQPWSKPTLRLGSRSWRVRRCCDKCGSSTTISRKGKSNGGRGHKPMSRRECCVPRMIRRPARAKSGKPPGWATKFT